MNKRGGVKRIKSGGVQYRFWRGFLWYVFPSREFSTPLCRSLIKRGCAIRLGLELADKVPLPTREGFFSSFKIDPAVRAIASCLAAIFASRHQDVSPGALGNEFLRHIFADIGTAVLFPLDFLRENCHAHKIPRFRGGVFGALGGGEVTLR